MPTKKTSSASKPAAKKPAASAKKPSSAKKPAAAANNAEITGLVETVVKKLTGDSTLLEKFKTNAMAVVKKILPNIKDTDILNAIITALKTNLNLGSILDAITGKDVKKDNKKDDKKEEGGLLNSVMGLFSGK